MKAYIAISNFGQRVKAMRMLGTCCEEIDIRKKGSRPNEEELIEIVDKYDVLIIGIKEIMTERVYKNASQLKYLCSLSIGKDHICKSFLESNRISVITAPMANVFSVAEYMLSYALSTLKGFDDGDKCFRNGTGREGLKHIPYELSSQKVALIGAGKIAEKFIELASPFGPELFCWTLNPSKHEHLSSYGVSFISLEDLRELSVDYLIIAIPLSKKTTGLINRPILNALAKDTIIINISRLKIIDINSFLEFTEQGKFSNSLIDCFQDELDIPFDKFLNITLAPHVAGITRESRLRMGEEVIQGILDSELESKR